MKGAKKVDEVAHNTMNMMKGPNPKDTTSYTAVRGLDLGGLSKMLLGPHQVGRLFPLVCVFCFSILGYEQSFDSRILRTDGV